MKRHILIYPILVIAYAVLWIAGIMIGLTIFPPEADLAAESSGVDPMIFVISALNVLVLYLYVLAARPDYLWARVTAIAFGVTFLITQIESLWFIEALSMDQSMIIGLMTGGLISSVTFSWLLVKLTGKPLMQHIPAENPLKLLNRSGVLPLIILAVFIWPALYFVAGYYIAWQSEAVRMYYAESSGMESFMVMMVDNVADGLYAYQIFRALIWMLLAWLIVTPLSHSSLLVRILLTGSLIAVPGSSQLMLENTFMPESVRWTHLVEILISTFIWGALLGWVLGRPLTSFSKKEPRVNVQGSH